MKKPKEYELVKMADVLDIPEERFDAFLADMKKWHKASRATKELLVTIAKATGEKLPENFITMRWIDDGKPFSKPC